MLRPRGFVRLRFLTLSMVLLLIAVVPFVVYSSSGAVQLTYRRLQLSDGTVGVTGVKYNYSFNTNTSGPIGSVTFTICTNYLYDPSDVCITPNGFDVSAATLTNQTGINDFTIKPGVTGSKIVLVRSMATPVTPQQLTMEFSNITNPTDVGSYYVRIQTFASTDGNGTAVDDGIVVFAVNNDIGISTEVPPYLLFCTGITIDNYDCSTAAGSFISFGELSSKTPKAATSQLLASTNAPYGYSVTLGGNTMTAGNNVIPAMTGTTSVPGTSQFGLNARANSGPQIGEEPQGPGLTNPANGYNTPNKFRFVSGDIIASSNDTDDYRKLTMSYIVNRSADQPPGNYVSTIAYICLANF